MWAVITQKNVSYVVESAEYFGTTWWFKRARWRLSLKTWTCTVLFALAIDYFRIPHNALCPPPPSPPKKKKLHKLLSSIGVLPEAFENKCGIRKQRIRAYTRNWMGEWSKLTSFLWLSAHRQEKNKRFIYLSSTAVAPRTCKSLSTSS